MSRLLFLASLLGLSLQLTLFTLQNVIDGRFDANLRAWARDAKTYQDPLLVEFGTETNGAWFRWNGNWNGAGEKSGFGNPAAPDGPERFVAAY